MLKFIYDIGSYLVLSCSNIPHIDLPFAVVYVKLFLVLPLLSLYNPLTFVHLSKHKPPFFSSSLTLFLS